MSPPDRPTVAYDDGCAPSPLDTSEAFDGLWQGEDYRDPFVIGREQQGVTTWFGTATERAFKSGRAHVVMQIDESLPWQRTRFFRLVGRSLASIPGALLQRLPATGNERVQAVVGDRHSWRIPPGTPLSEEPVRVRLEFTPSAERDGAAYFVSDTVGLADDGYIYSHQVTVPPFAWLVGHGTSKPTLGPSFEEMLIHEFAHVLDFYAGFDARAGVSHRGSRRSPWSEKAAWQNAIAQSPCAVSEYATTNSAEDFAESVLAWFGYYAGRQGRLDSASRAALRERLGARFAVLSRLMHDRF